jgi:hypothetical protein
LEVCGEGFLGGDGLVVVLEVDSDVRNLFYAEMVRLALGFAIVVIVTDERGFGEFG